MRAAFVLKDRSDRELLEGVWAAVRRECEDVALVIAHLAEMDKRKLFAEEGCSSLRSYCTEVLHLSEDQAYTRIGVARVAQKFPVVLDMLADGLVHATAVHRLGPSLTPENHVAVLEEATHKSMAQVEEIVARLRPKPPVPTRILKASSSGAGAEGFFESPSDFAGSGTEAGPVGPALPGKSAISPLAPELYDVHFTADKETVDALKLLQELLSHQVPSGDPAVIIKDALLRRLEQAQRQRYGKGKRPRKGSGAARKVEPTASAAGVPAKAGAQNALMEAGGSERSESRHIPNEVKSAVWERDQGRCAFVARNGRQCSERRWIEFHHIIPFAWRGESTVDNIELRCRAHNAYEGELIFGKVIRKKEWALRAATRFETSSQSQSSGRVG